MAPFLNWIVSGSAAFISSPSWNKGKNINIGQINTSPFLHKIMTRAASKPQGEQQEEGEQQVGDLSRLVKAFGGYPTHLLRLFTTPNGTRGIFLNEPVQHGDSLLQIPLSSCLRDDEPLSWLEQKMSGTDGNDGSQSPIQIQGWVTRLTARLLEVQNLDKDQPPNFQEWLRLLPPPASLRESLPIYWTDSVLQSTECRPLELAVDSAFFARAGPLENLLGSNVTQAEIEWALDLVQTRACRCTALGGEDDDDNSDSSDLRVLAPIFDFINHDYEPNAEFFRQGDYIAVRAIRDIEAGEEVLIHYGSSTMPAWKCLFSYGFVPPIDQVYDHSTAEIVIDDIRFEVSPIEIPFELIQYQAQKLGCDDVENIEFTPQIGRAIVDELVASAKTLEATTSSEEGIVDASLSPISLQLVANLRETHRATLLACAEGLREYVEEQE